MSRERDAKNEKTPQDKEGVKTEGPKGTQF